MDEKDRNRLISHFNDLALRADRIGFPQFSDFLDSAEQDLVSQLYDSGTKSRKDNVRVVFDGGYEGAERRMAAFYPLFYSEEEKAPLTVWQIALKGAKFLKVRPAHRDYLGAVLGCGIERRTVGDIILNEEGAVIVLSETMGTFLSENLFQVGRAEVELFPFEGDISQLTGSGRTVSISLSSMRLDGVVGHGFQMGRGDATELIKAGRVEIDHRLCTKPDQEVKPGSLITVRGKGRLKLAEETGVSRSGRIQIKGERFG